MADTAPILDHLRRAREGVLAAAATVPADRWRQPPQPGAWSAGEVFAHLLMVESAITRGATKLLQGPPRPVPLWKRLHLPVRLAAWRGVRARTPIPLDPHLVSEKQEMVERLAELRRETIRLLESVTGRDLRAYRWRHPLFGSLNFYDWFRVMAFHEQHHTEQIREIVRAFQS